jgi:kinetochore protein NDC80
MSMVPRPGGIPQSSIGGAGSADSVMTTVKRHKSYAPSSSQPPQSSRRSSQFGRASIGASGSFFTGVTSAVALKDPRPLKNSTYQAKMAEEVTNYLVLNGFEASTGHSLSPNAMRKPTQKDFYNVFQWLYKKLDPNYRFTSPKIENEVIPLLKAIRYPYASSITKTQLTAVGSGNAWPIFLGLLNWMVQLITVVDRVQSGEYDDAAEIEGDMFADKITFRYLTQCYNAWLRENDDHSEFEREMAEAFQERDAKFLEEFHELEADNERLKRQLEELEKDAQVLPKLQEEKAVLENDRKKYLHWIEKVEAKTKKTNEVIERIVPQLEQMKEDQEKAAKLKDTLQAQVDAQGLLPPDIDRLNSKRDKINQGLAQISIKAQEVQSNLDEREAQAQTNFEALERAVSRYNKLAYQIGITPNTANNAKNKDYELHISPSADLQASEGNKLLLENRTGYQPSQILNLDLRHDVKPFLVSLIKEIKDKILDSQDEFSKNQELIERVTEGLQEHKDEIETMEARIQAANNEYQQLKEVSVNVLCLTRIVLHNYKADTKF